MVTLIAIALGEIDGIDTESRCVVQLFYRSEHAKAKSNAGNPGIYRLPDT